jgi:hypothetical protein
VPDDSKKKYDAFIAKVVSDPTKPPETLLIQGFLGASSEADHTRVYADVTLDSYVDVANADIIHMEPLPKEQSPMGGSYLWIKKSADVLPGSGEAERKGAKFLEGPIAAQAAAGGQQAAPAAPITLPLVACHPTILVQACPSLLVHLCPPSANHLCPSIQIKCPPTPQVVCPPTPLCPPTPHLICPPPRTPFCPVSPFCPSVNVICHTLTEPHCFVSGGPGCGVTPQQGGVGGGEGFAAMAAPQVPPSILPQLACPTIPAACPSVAVCPTEVPIHCPTHVQCPSVAGFHCPSVAGYQCPSVAGFHCPSVAGYQCPSVAGFHCPSVAGFQCPSVAGFHCPTPNPAFCPTPNHHCPPTPSGNCPTPNHECPITPQPQHCPTPNMMCPHPTTTFQCPSVGEVCPTSSPLFC